MPNTKHNIKYNDSGYMDSTAYEALKNIQREERHHLISELKKLAQKYGYMIVSTIELRAMGGGKDE